MTIGLLTALAPSLLGRPAHAGMPKAVWQFESSPSGEVSVVARAVPIAQALTALANEGGFEVLMDDGVTRPPVDLTMPMGSIEDILREMLRGRNYALVYDGATESLSRVILLAPSKPGPPSSARRIPARKARQKTPAPIVVRN
jgi:hypothetical protein